MHIRQFTISYNTIKTKNQKSNYINQNNTFFLINIAFLKLLYFFFLKIYDIKYTNKMSRKGRKWSIFSILNEEETSEISSSRCSSWRFNTSSIRNRSINIIEEEEDTISRRLVRYDYIKYNSKMVDSHIKVIHESRNQGSQASIIAVFDKLFIQEESEANVEKYEWQSESDFEKQYEETLASTLVRQYEETSASALARQTIKNIEQILDNDEY